MTRYKLTIEYFGGNFIGWQKQQKGYSVQETIEKAAKNFLQEDIELTVAGRTDAGVHADSQVVHLDIKKKINIKSKIISKHSNYLGSDLDYLILMSKFKNFIISNSSFYWWAAYISEMKGEIKIKCSNKFVNFSTVPKRWNKNN